jgi:hypothetical protein
MPSLGKIGPYRTDTAPVTDNWQSTLAAKQQQQPHVDLPSHP